jgi:competence ComEA-like helix-hairpin-helix protein
MLRRGYAPMYLMRARLGYVLLAHIGVLAGTTVTCVAQASKAPTRTEAADKADFEAVCGACNTSSMVSYIRTEPEWKDTVELMVSLGADGTGEQMEAVMRVLLRTLTKVNANTATAAQLALALDVSETTALAVVKYRAEHGKFKSLADLTKVPGINAAKLDARKDRVAF